MLEATTFVPFSAQHGWTVLTGAVAVALLLWTGRRGEKAERGARAVLAFLCLSASLYSQLAWIGVPRAVTDTVPFQLCDLAAITAGFALITQRYWLALLTYYWGLAATIQGLATPAVTVGFPHPGFIAFFFHHFAVVAAALYLPVVNGWRPRRPLWKPPLWALAASLSYASLAGLLNWLLGANFGFLAKKPDNPSLLDSMGPWPVYIGVEAVIALVFFGLLTLPFIRSAAPRKGQI